MAGSDSRGFTLLELMVVLVIATLMIALVPPMLSGLGGFLDLKGAARQLAAGLRSARNEAVLTRREAVLTVDLEQRVFSLTGGAREYSLPEKGEIKLFTAESELEEETRGSIRFFPDGSSTGGRIMLTDGRGGYVVNVDWLTGRIKIVEQEVQ
jgi:general secretion pathway protein H